ncbi:SapB/AmfS family lanthipeptide [Pseudonocardia sp. TRM90224]
MNQILQLQTMDSAPRAAGGPDNPFSTFSLTVVCLTSTISIVACVP